MTPRILSAGDRALLVQADDLETTLTVASLLRQARLPQVEDLVPAAETVLVRVADGTELTELSARILDLITGSDAEAAGGTTGDPLVIPVHYDGPDLSDVARATGLSIAEVIAAHTGTVWRAAFVGFAPGFAYLAGGDERLQVPRRSESRTSVPAGSVALAGHFSAVYPRRSPGGWQLIGSTPATLWDVAADPPAAIQPGGWVRFVDADADPRATDHDDVVDRTSVGGPSAMTGGRS